MGFLSNFCNPGRIRPNLRWPGMAFGITTLSHKFAPQHYITTLHQNIAPNNFTSKLCTTQLYSKTPKPIAHVPHFQYGKTLVFFSIAHYCNVLFIFALLAPFMFCNFLHLAMSCTTLVCSKVCSGAEMRSKYYLGYFHRRGQFWSFPRVARVGALGAEKFVSRNPSSAHCGTKIQTFLGLPPTIRRGQSTHISLVHATTQIKER